MCRRPAPHCPGLQVAGRQLADAQDQQLQSQTDYLNNLILLSILLLAVVTVVNTLVMTTVDRRQALLLLRRVGATTGQLLRATAWQSALLAVTGIALGIAAGGVDPVDHDHGDHRELAVHPAVRGARGNRDRAGAHARRNSRSDGTCCSALARPLPDSLYNRHGMPLPRNQAQFFEGRGSMDLAAR